MKVPSSLLLILFATAALAEKPTMKTPSKATLGGGCFWCVEAVYEEQPGILSVVSGYAGGPKPNPTYEEVCRGQSGHAEVVQIEYDPEIISYEKIIDLFWSAHDPTTLNRQGNDVGTQYRSIILTENEKENGIARASMGRGQSKFNNPIVTEIIALEKFYVAEEEHQDFYRNNPMHPYNRAVIRPKLEKLKEQKKSDES